MLYLYNSLLFCTQTGCYSSNSPQLLYQGCYTHIHYSLKSPSNYQCNADSPKVLRLDWNVYFG